MDIKNGVGVHPVTGNPIPHFNIVAVLVVDQHQPSSATMQNGDASQALLDLFIAGIVPVAPAGDAMGFSIGNAGVGYPAYDEHTISVAACFDKSYSGDFHFCGAATGTCDPLAPDNQTNYSGYANPAKFLAMSQRQRQSTLFNPQGLRHPLDIVSPGAEIFIPVPSASTPAGARPLEKGYGTVYGAAYVTAAIAQSIELSKKFLHPLARFADIEDVRDALQSSSVEVLNHEDESDIEDNVADLGGTFNGPGDELGRVKRLRIPSLISTTVGVVTFPPTLPGDFDDDGNVDVMDVCELQIAIELQSTDLTYDLNNDQSVTFADLEFLIHNVLLTVFGDANLDRKVDPADMNIVGQYFGQTGVCWEQGDFNGDDEVDTADFNYVGSNWLFGTQ